MPQTPKVELQRGHGLGTVRTMPEFRAFAAQSSLTAAQRRTLVDQAEILIEGLYVHLPLKRAMHAIDPLQRLRLLRLRMGELTEDQFHVRLLRIIIELRDLHTNYILPTRYRGFAFLGILIERFYENGQPRWLVSKVFDHLVGDTNLVVGAEITHWNGMPMAIAVERNAEREAGSNMPARLARGLENMTLRPVSMSLPAGRGLGRRHATASARSHVRRASRGGCSRAPPRSPAATRARACRRERRRRPSQLVGLDLRTELARQIKLTLFAPSVAKEQRRVKRAKAAVPRATKEQAAAGIVPTTRPEELKARTVDHGERHLRPPADLHVLHGGRKHRGVPRRGREAARCASPQGVDPGRAGQRRRLRDRRRVSPAVPVAADDPSRADAVHQHALDRRSLSPDLRARAVACLDRRGDRDGRPVLERDSALPGGRGQQRRPALPRTGRAGHGRPLLQRDRHLLRRLPGSRDRQGARRRRQHGRRRSERLDARRPAPELAGWAAQAAARRSAVPGLPAPLPARWRALRPARRGPGRRSGRLVPA